MHKLMSELKSEIHEMTDKGIKSKDLTVLGQLVDMYKDLTNVCYWEYKMEVKDDHEYSVEWTHEGAGNDMDVHRKIEEVKAMIDIASRGGAVDKAKLEKYLEDMLDTSEKIHTVVGHVKMPDSMVARFKALYK